MWIVTQAKDQLGMDIEKIVLAGDSAGGHLTQSVTLLAMLRGFRLPDGLLTLYPVLSLNMNSFFPSNLMMSDDEVISTGFLIFCSSCVLRKGGNGDVNPVMSPIIAPDCMLRRIPPTHFLVCEIDGLRDQVYAMAIRMLKQGGRVHIHNFAEFVHGWCNMDTNGLTAINEFRRATNTVVAIFRELLDLPVSE